MTKTVYLQIQLHVTAFLLGVLTLLVGLPAYAHDPLRDADDAHHGDIHHSEQAEPLAVTDSDPNLTEARRLVVAFRETGDDQNLEAAWELLKPAIDAEFVDPQTLVTAAFVAQSRHDFDYALRLIKRALAINSHNDEGWLLLASIHLVSGETAQAAAACGRLLSSPPLVLLTCKARLALAEGDHQIALSRLTAVLAALGSERSPDDILAWSYSVAGDLAVRADESNRALAFYRTSLGFAERTQVRAALVDVLLSAGDFESAWQALTSAPPALPLLVRRLIAAKKLDRMDELQPVLSRVQREFKSWIADEDWLHAREMTRFFVDVVEQPELARRLALINIELQQEPEDLRLERRTRLAATG